LVALPCTNAHALLGLLGELDAHMSEFNPIGHHLIDPINEAVPRLHIKGFLRLDANMNLHSDDRSIGAAKINKDWRMQKIEWLAEIEASYRLTDSWQLVAVSHFLYDSVYDWQHSHGLYADRTDRTSHYYHRGEQILREFYLKGYWGNFDFYLGKQQIVWGKMEGRVIDVINPMDSRESPLAEWQADYEYRRMPLWMTNITYNWTDCSLQFLWIPDFEEGYGPLTPGAPYHPTAIAVPSVARFYDSDKPSTSFEDHEWALRFNMTKGDWEFALFYFYTWSDSPTNFMRTFRLVAPRDGLITVEVEPKHTRQHMFGAMVETGFYGLGRHWVVSNEVLYTMNKYFSVDDESLLPWNLEDGYKKRDEIFFGSRWMTSFFRGEVNVIFQPLIKYVPGYSHNHSQTGSNQKLLYGALTVISKSYEFTGDRLNTTYYCLGFFNAHPSEQEGVRQLLEVRWKVSDYIKTILYYETFNGDHQGIYGSYDKYDNIGLYIKYAF
ncbi:MAG: hypothetical protein GY868_16090, partial [Deltaproteobacteria bacterium]|nr:hypothetical protein [Deltaproteobacteria bacterium]